MLLEQTRDLLPGQSRVVLETDRLVLRVPTLADVKAIAMLANDRRIAENTRCLPHPYTLADAETFVASVQGRVMQDTFLITQDGETPVGICGLDWRSDTPDIGYWLGTRYWRRGLGTEAARALLDHAFAAYDIQSVLAGARVTNPASRRLLEKCGFQWTGVELHRIRALGSSTPVDRFRLDRRIWASLKNWRSARRVA